MDISKKAETFGDRLKKRREELGLSVEEVAQEIAAPQKYVQAFEKNQYGEFSAKIYAIGFVKKLLIALAVPNVYPWIQEFSTEWDVAHFHLAKSPISLPHVQKRFFVITPQRAAFISAGIGFVVLGIFILNRFTTFIRPPKLIIDQPRDERIITIPYALVKGTVEKESHLTVNGREIRIDELGNFNEEIGLGAGLNTLEFIAENRFGKQTAAVRHIVVQ